MYYKAYMTFPFHSLSRQSDWNLWILRNNSPQLIQKCNTTNGVWDRKQNFNCVKERDGYLICTRLLAFSWLGETGWRAPTNFEDLLCVRCCVNLWIRKLGTDRLNTLLKVIGGASEGTSTQKKTLWPKTRGLPTVSNNTFKATIEMLHSISHWLCKL